MLESCRETAVTPVPSSLTSTGVVLFSQQVLFPSLPNSLNPQHFTPPAVVSAQVWNRPAAMAATPAREAAHVHWRCATSENVGSDTAVLRPSARSVPQLTVEVEPPAFDSTGRGKGAGVLESCRDGGDTAREAAHVHWRCATSENVGSDTAVLRPSTRSVPPTHRRRCAPST